MAKTNLTVNERFWMKVDKSGSCWNWTACKNSDGYGQFWIDVTNYLAHRIAYELAFGPIPDRLHVLHHCDNPGCVRVSHLFLGTDKDNMDDKTKKGRGNQASGEKHGMAKLTEDKVKQIRKAYSDGNTTLVKLAEKYEVEPKTIHRVIHAETWKNVK